MSRQDVLWNPPSRTAPKHPPFTWFGGKWKIAHWIIQHLPAHRTYVEPFGGAGSVLMQKAPSPIEVYNDRDRLLSDFFKVCRDHVHELVRALAMSPYHRGDYAEALERLKKRPPANRIERARLFAVVAGQSFAGMWGRSWGFAKTQSSRGISSKCSGWLNLPTTLYAVADRLLEVQIESYPAIRLIRLYDTRETCFYCDPPYHPDTRQDNDVYVHEMTADQHGELLESVNTCQGNVVLSGYRCPVYDRALKRWKRYTRNVPCTSRKVNLGESRPRRIEVLWVKR